MSPVEFFTDHTYRTVVLGTTLIGLVAGGLGCFPYLRRQSLISDVISHAALPGAMAAFLIAVTFGTDGRSMVVLLIGSLITASLAVLTAQAVVRTTKIAIDTAMAITLTVFFGVGMLLLRVISNGPFPGKGGIGDYLFGNASVMTMADVWTTAVAGGAAVLLTIVCWKEFALRTFDPDHSTTLGFRPGLVDALLFAAVVVATVLGVKAVGLVLMVALVVTPPAAARQWTTTLPAMVATSALIGAIGSAVGSYLSIVWGPLPTGPVIVLTLFAIFVVSLLGAPRRGLLAGLARRHRARRVLLHQLRAEAERASAR